MQKHEQKKEGELNGHYFSSSARGDERRPAYGPRFVSAQTHGWNFRVGGGEQHPGGLCCLIYGTHLTEMQMIGLIEN